MISENRTARRFDCRRFDMAGPFRRGPNRNYRKRRCGPTSKSSRALGWIIGCKFAADRLPQPTLKQNLRQQTRAPKVLQQEKLSVLGLLAGSTSRTNFATRCRRSEPSDAS